MKKILPVSHSGQHKPARVTGDLHVSAGHGFEHVMFVLLLFVELFCPNVKHTKFTRNIYSNILEIVS